MSDERPNSLAAQAASWVPPWERSQRPPDSAYAESAPEPDISDDIDEPAVPQDDAASQAVAQGDADEPAVLRDGAVSQAVAQGDADGSDDDSADDGGAPEPAEDDGGLARDVPAELPPLPGEAAEGGATVDAPQELPGEEPLEPTEVGGGPEVPLPPSISDAVEDADAGLPGSPVDAPLPPDGDDAGDVFDQAADDQVDDAEIDLPFAEEIPEDGATGGDEAVGLGDDAAPSDSGAAGVGDDLAAAGAGAAAGAAGGGARRRGAGIPAQKRERGDSAAAAGDGGPRTSAEAEPPALMDEGEMRAALESILLVVDEPVAEMQLAQILEQPTERVAAMLEDISARYTAAGHGFDLRRAAGGWRLYTRPEYAAYVERFVLDGQSVRLTQAALETLSVVAYKQPVTRSRISAIRGVNCDGVMRTLVTRGLVEECGTESETGAYLYRTTVLFLEKLGLNSVDELPPLAPFLPDDVEEVLDASG